jgi:predicted nucleotidyltransferase
MNSPEIINTIIELATKVDWIESVLLVGSAAKKGIENANDIDLLIISEGLNPKELRLASKQFIKSLAVPKFYLNQDVLRFFDKTLNKEVSLAFRIGEEFHQKVSSIIKGDYEFLLGYSVIWSAGGSLPELLLFDLSTSKILYDARGNAEILKAKLAQFPSGLKCELARILRFNIKSKIKLITKETFEVIKLALYAEVLMSFIRLLFVENMQFFMGYKHLSEHELKLDKQTDNLLNKCMQSKSYNEKIIAGILTYLG